jgi:hypothetical protein
VVYLYRQQHAGSASTGTHACTVHSIICSNRSFVSHSASFLRKTPVSAEVSGWVLQTILTPLSPSPANHFGAALAIFHTSDANGVFTTDEDLSLDDAYVAVVGAPCDTSDASGRVYLYMSTKGEQWQRIGHIGAQEGASFDDYGSSVALLGPHLVVGAPLAHSAAANRAGAVYVEVSLLPYLVAAAQAGGDGGDGDGGNDDGSEQGGGSRAWRGFLSFFTSSGGIVAMSFLPVAVVAAFFVAHKKAKGDKILTDPFTKCRGGASQQLLPSCDPDFPTHKPAADEEGTPTASTTSPTADTTVGYSGQLIADRAWAIMRAVTWPQRTKVVAHSPLPCVADGTEAGPVLIGSEDGAATSAGAGADLRVGLVICCEGPHPSLSIRSPITHVPLHSSLLLSPRTHDPAAVKSFRLVEAGSERRQPSPVSEDLSAAAAELQRIKAELNKEFAAAGNGSPTAAAAGFLPSAVTPEPSVRV